MRPVTMFRAVFAAAVCLVCTGWASAQAVVEGTVFSNAVGPGQIWVWASTSGAWGTPCVVAGTPSARGYLETPPVAYQLQVPFNSNVWVMACKDNSPPFFPPPVGMDPTQGDPKAIHSMTPFFVASGPVTGRDIAISASSGSMNPVLLLNMDGFDFEARMMVGWQISDLRYTSDSGSNELVVMYGGGWGIHDNGDVPLVTVVGFPNTRSDPTAVQPIPGHVYTFLTDQGKTVRMKVLRVGTFPNDVEFVFDHDYTMPPPQPGSIEGNVVYTGTRTGVMVAFAGSDPQFRTQPEHHTEVMDNHFQLRDLNPAVTWYVAVVLFTRGTMDLTKYDPWGIHGTTVSPTPVRVLSGQIINIPNIALVDGTDEVPNPFWSEKPLCRTVCEYPDRYRVEFEVEADSSAVTAVRVTGPGIGGQTNGTMNLGYADGRWSSWALGWQNDAPQWNGQPPALPLTYTFALVDPTTTTYRTWQVTGFYQSYAVPMAPSHNAAVPGPANVVFQWMPAAGAGRYGIEVRERYDYGGRFMWGYYDISPQQTSIQYNFDQRGAPLEFGKIYEWNVRASSAGGAAESVSQIFHFIVSTGGFSIGQAKVSGKISYTGGVSGDLQVMLGFGMPGPSWTPVSTLNLGPQSGVFNGRPYFMDNVASGSDYYVVAMIDDNDPMTPAEQHPAGFYGPFAVSGAMEQRNADITVYNRTGSTGNNTITGGISYGAGVVGSPQIFVEAGIGGSTGDIYEVRGTFTRYGPGSFTIAGLPDGMPYYVRAYADLNGDAMRNPSEPWGFVGPFTLTGSTVVTTAVSLTDPAVAATTITVTLRALVRDAAGQPMPGAVVFLVDTGGYNDYQPANDVIIATRTTLLSPATYYDAGLGVTLQYNCQFSSVTLKVNQGPNVYGYLLQASRQGFRTDTVHLSFDASWDGGLWHAGTLHLSAKPPVTIADLGVYPPVISPDFDGFDDTAHVGFTYIVGSSETLWQNGASVRMVVDTNRNGIFDPVDERMFFYDNQGRRWLKKSLNDTIDYNNPDYSRLIGPLSEDQYNALVSTSDVSVQEYVDGWGLQVMGGSATARVQLSWEGRDPVWNPVANGIYLMRIEVDDPTFDEKDGINAVAVTSVTVLTAGIRGRVTDAMTGQPVPGARVSAGGTSGGNQAYTRADGTFEVSGLRAGEQYGVSIQRAGYIVWTQEGIPASLSTGTAVQANLARGVPVSGLVTLPHPPQAGTVRDQWNNLMYDIWVQVRADNMSGPGSGWTDVRVPLPAGPGVSQAVAGYELFVAPNSKQRISATAPGYVAAATVLNVTASSVTHHIGLIRAARLESSVQLSTDPAAIDELRVHSRGQGLNVNVYANTKDGTGGTSSWVYFSDQELAPGASRQFVLDALTPNTTYTLGVESGLLARREFTVMVGSGTILYPPITLAMGARLAGVIRVLDDVNDIVSRYSWWEGNQTPGFWVQIGLTNRQDFTRSWTSVFVSTVNGWGADLSSATFTVIGLQPGASYSMSLSGVGALDIEPGESDRIVEISSVASVTQAPPILMRRATGVVRGRVVNATGKPVDLSAVKVVSVMTGGEGDGPRVWPVAPDGTFAIEGLRTGRMIMWGTEYSVPPLSGNADFFGTATGNAGTFFRDVYVVSRTTVTLGDIPLKPGSTLQVVLNGPEPLIDALYAQTTSFHALVAAGRVETDGPFGFMRVQPVFFREIAQELVSADAEDGMHPKDIAFTLDTSIERVSSTSIRYTMPGLEQGIYYVYPMVGTLDIARYRTTDYMWHEKSRLRAEGWTAFPLEQAVTMGRTETRQVGFGISAGVNVFGSVRRPQSALGTGETVNVSVKDAFSGMQVASADVVFFSTRPVTDASFSFSKLPPGSYTLTVWSPGYKLVSQPLALAAQQSTVSVPVIVLGQGAAIVGRLMDAAGNAVRTGVKVECRALPYVEGSYRDTTMPGLAISTVSATAGRFRFPNMPAGTYVVRVTPTADAAAGYVVTVKSGITVPDGVVDVDLGILQLQAGVDISGTVMLPDSATVAGVKVVAWPQDVQLRSGMELTAYTDAAGRFVITGVNPGIRFWELRCNVREQDLTKANAGLGAFGEYVLSNVDVTRSAARTNIQIRLQYAAGALAGTVVAANGAPLILPVQLPGINVPDFPAALLLLQSPRDAVSGDPMAGIRSITEATGDFLIDGIVPGPYILKVFARGFMTAVRDVVVSTGGMTNIGVVTLQTGRRVSGTIRTDTGGKVTRREASLVVATNRDHTRFAMGFVNTNPLTQEVNGYEINGLEPGVTYYAVIVPEDGGAVMVDPVPFWLVAGSDAVKNLVYLKPRPHFEVRNYRLPGLTKQRLQAFIAYERDRDLSNIMAVPFEEWGKYLLISRYMMEREEYLAAAPSTFTYYFVYGFITEPVRADTVGDIVSTAAASGLLIPLELAATRKQLALGYIPAGDDFGRGYFELLFSAANYYGAAGEDRYRFHLGEDARSEKVINPLMGGSAYLGDGDDSGLEVPPGSIDDPTAISSGTKIVVLKLEPDTMRQAGAGGLARHLFSRRVPNTTYPGELMSAVYDMQLLLVSGPLASLAQNRTVTIHLALSSAAVPAEAAQYRLHTFNEQQNRWVPETGPQSIDWGTRTMTAQVGHLTAFAVFKVATSTGMEPGPQPYDGPFAAYVYPNPARAAAALRFRIALPQHAGQATLPVTVRIYTMAGKLVRTLHVGELATGMRHDVSWEPVNDGGGRLASGVYIFHLKAGGVYTELKKFAIVR